MSNLTYIYQKNVSEIKLLDTLNYTLEEFKTNPQGCYPGFNKENMVVSSEKYDYPCIDYSGELRNKTREERIIEGEIELLQDGEYMESGIIKIVPAPETLLKKAWDRESRTWKEGATEEEITDNYFTKINKYKAEILENGFDFNGHQQKCREKDLALLGNAIAANEDAQPFATTPVTHWSFNDHDVVEMSLDELKKLRIDGATFVQAVFIIEAQLKATQPNILLEKQDFIEKIDELSTVKCFKESI